MAVLDVNMDHPAIRLGLPGAIIFVIGAAMIYVALRGWDAKYGLVGGRLAGSPRPDAPVEPSPSPTDGGDNTAGGIA